MKTVYALAAAGLLALSVPAVAQNAGAPGASGAGNGLTGSNTGTGPATQNTDSNKLGGASGMSDDGMNEGRAAAPNTTNTPQDPANPNPTTVRGDQNGQSKAKP